MSANPCAMSTPKLERIMEQPTPVMAESAIFQLMYLHGDEALSEWRAAEIHVETRHRER